MRKLGYFEKLMCFTNLEASTNFCIHFSMKNILSKDRIDQALADLQQSQEMLMSSISIHDQAFVKVDKILISHYSNTPKEQHVTQIETMLADNFDLPNALLLKPIVLADPDTNITTIGLIFHHACGDGASALRLTIDLLMHLDGNQPTSQVYHNIPPTLESHFIEDEAIATQANYLLDKANIATNTTSQNIHAIKVDKPQLQQFLDTCRTTKTTFHTRLAAILAEAVLDQVSDEKVIIQSPVNTREANAEYCPLVYLASRIDYNVNRSNQSLTEKSQAMKSYFSSNLNAHCAEAVKSIKTYIDILEKSNITVLKLLRYNKTPSIFFTNIGKLSLPHPLENIDLLDISFVLSSNAMLPNSKSILVSALSFENDYSMINIHFPEGSSLNAEQLCTAVTNKIALTDAETPQTNAQPLLADK